jgi:hypothetical protein
LLDANRRPISEAYGFAAEMQADALRVVEGNKYFPKNWIVVKDLVETVARNDRSKFGQD